jgi:hypothetical protein
MALMPLRSESRQSSHLTLFLYSAYPPRHHPASPVHRPSCPESGRMPRPGGRGLRRRRPFRARLSIDPTAPSGMARAAGTPVLPEGPDACLRRVNLRGGEGVWGSGRTVRARQQEGAPPMQSATGLILRSRANGASEDARGWCSVLR